MKHLPIKLSFVLCLVTLCAEAQDNSYISRFDSIMQVREIVVTSKPTYREVIPSQKLKGEQLERMSSQSVADALRYFSGVQLKDYGGVGGVKTVDVRSMGTNHLAVSYDGIVLGNAQNGQTDLGQFSLDNVEEISLYNGQKSAIFQSAADFASASSVYIRTRVPLFDQDDHRHLKLKAKYGASDLFRVSALWEEKLSEKLSLSTNAEFLTASGRYKFRYKRKNLDGTTAWDTTATRRNGDIHAERVEANLHGRIAQGGWLVKAYLYNSARGIPGAIVNNVWHRGERQEDLNTFVQTQWHKGLSDRFSTQLLAKYAYYDTHYKNDDETQLPVDNRYRQQELYLSNSNVYELLPNWSASACYDLRWNKLDADLYAFVKPRRFTHMLSVATAWDYKILKMQASVVETFVSDHTTPPATAATGGSSATTSKLTPAIFANIAPFGGKRFFSMRAFVKRSFRMPTFNDLYYTSIGNAALKPESALQLDFGLVLDKHFSDAPFTHVGLHADVYYNKVKDKIIAYPKGQQFRWTMLNLGKVDIKGLDVVAEGSFRLPHQYIGTLRAQYTYQDSRDVTDPSTPYYRNQIPYIPWHSGSAIIGLEHKQLTVNYSFLYTGRRYNGQENAKWNYMQPWYTSDISASYVVNMRRCDLRISGEINNLLNQQYDVILNYPMPGRNAALTLEVMINK